MLMLSSVKKRTKKEYVCKIVKKFRPSYIIVRIQRLRANGVDLDKVTHYVPPYQGLRRFPNRLLTSLTPKCVKQSGPQDQKSVIFSHSVISLTFQNTADFFLNLEKPCQNIFS